MKKYESFVIELTAEQQAAVHETMQAIGPDEAVIAQVYGDGMRVKLLTAEQANTVRKVTGADSQGSSSNSAFVAHEQTRLRIQ